MRAVYSRNGSGGTVCRSSTCENGYDAIAIPAQLVFSPGLDDALADIDVVMNVTNSVETDAGVAQRFFHTVVTHSQKAERSKGQASRFPLLSRQSSNIRERALRQG
jgi:hypothetical protein